MAITEESRHQLFQRLESVLGLEQATTLMEHLPPVGWADVATKRDLNMLESKLEARIDRLDSKIDRMADKLRAEFHSGLRATLLGMVAANAAMAGVIVAALRLG